MSDRPNCVNCGKPLGKWIGSVSVPLNRDAEIYIHEQFKGRTHRIMDKYETIRDRQWAQQRSYEARVERQEQAKMRLMPGSNEPIKEGWSGHMERRHAEDDAADFQLSMFETRVRVWFGDYGPDRRGLFHSGTCAQDWANKLASRLRAEGKV